MTTTSTTTETGKTGEGTEATTESTETTTGTETVTDWKAEAEKLKAIARKHEDRAKANAQKAKDYDELAAKSMTDQEKAVKAAGDEARKQTLFEVGGKLTLAAIKAAATGRVADVDALIEGVDASKFTGDDGEPDEKAIQAWLDRVAPVTEQKQRQRDLGQGVRNGGQSTALDSDPLLRDLKGKLGIS